jgi:prepilin-type N-terminal cleavage/methylation domain-containing protein
MKTTLNRSPRVRRGVSLMELLIVMTVLAVILSTSSVTLFRLLQAQTAGTTALAESLTTARLARDLRRDAHSATAATLTGGDKSTTLTLTGAPTGEVRYSIDAAGLTRMAETADKQALRESYQLGAVDIACELTEGERLITLSLRSRAVSQAESPNLDAPLQPRPRELTTIQAAVRR